MHLLSSSRSIYAPPWRPLAQLRKTLMHPRQKGQAFSFDAVLLLAGAALGGQLRR